MDILVDYVRWMGDLTFQEKPFGEVDALVVSMICYLDMKPVFRLQSPVEEGEAAPLYARGVYEGRMQLREICQRIEEQGLTFNIRTVGPDNGQQEFMHAAAASKRFGELWIHDYVDVFDHEEAIQYSSMTFDLDDQTRFLAYVGTDHTLAGWKEDFMFSFTHTPAQDMAVEYAERMIATEKDKRFYIGGQSKGGNLALYTACMLSDEAWDRVLIDYYLDGPGLDPAVVDHKKLARIQEKTLCVGPEYAIVGKLFPVEMKHTKIVRSNQTGLMQHALYSWAVDHGELDTVPENDPESVKINKAVDAWMAGIPQEERKKLVDELFDALEKDGAVTIDDIEAKGAAGFEGVLINVLGMSKETRQTFMELPGQALDPEAIAAVDAAKEAIQKDKGLERILNNRFFKAGAFLLAGAIIAISPSSVFYGLLLLVMLGIAVFEAAITARRLVKNHWNFSEERPRLAICLILLMFIVVVIVKENALFLLGSVVTATLFFAGAYISAIKLKETDQDTFLKVIHWGQLICCIIFGFSYLVIPEATAPFYTISIGLLFVVDGVLRLIHASRARKGKV